MLETGFAMAKTDLSPVVTKATGAPVTEPAVSWATVTSDCGR